ncbi:hypothetical protein [Pseudomonas sp. MPB26]|uniref:hypothetical protein n=1 Tax=Pseudomonas sp. MPB26 TaxID=3388491 RepID=UPI003984987D
MKNLEPSKAISLNSSSMKVYVVNCGYSARLFLDSHVDDYNDRIAEADEGASDDERYAWTITEIETDSNGRKIYSLQNSSYSKGFLFKGSPKDGDDYKVYGHNTDSIDSSKGNRYKFYMDEVGQNPVRYSIKSIDGYTLFAGVHKDGYSDHQVYARSGHQSDDRFKWYIFPV